MEEKNWRLDMPIVDIADTTWLALFLAPATGGTLEEVKLVIAQSLNKCWHDMCPRERSIMCAYYGMDGRLPKTMVEICASMGLSRKEVQTIRNGGLKKLRFFLRRGYTAFSLN